MVSRLACSITAAALVLSAQGMVPGWTAAALAAPAKHKNCTAKSHQHAKVAAARPAKPAQRGGGGAGGQMRRSPDVQILSFGP